MINMNKLRLVDSVKVMTLIVKKERILHVLKKIFFLYILLRIN